MAFPSHSSTNYEVEVPLAREYGRETAVSGSTAQYRYTRRTTKTYRYKGMTEAAAQACLAEKRMQYTRRFMSWKKVNGKYWNKTDWQSAWGSTPKDYYEQVATFNVIRQGAAPVFDVQISVDETVALYATQDYQPYSTEGCTSIEGLFNFFPSGVDPDIAPYGGSYSYVTAYSYDEPAAE